MTSLLNFGTRHGRDRSLLALYLLHSLSRSPKSGYDLIAEIKEKTGGLWVPSKGSLYPVLHQLEEEELVAVVETGKRSKMIFELTGAGRKTLDTIRNRGRESHKKMACCRNLVFDIFGGSSDPVHCLTFEIKDAIDGIPAEGRDEACRVLEECVNKLKRIS